MGGPQAGIITGSKIFINKIYENSFYRAFRCDKIRLSILETILRTYHTENDISKLNLTVKLFKRKQNALHKIGKKIITSCSNIKNYKISLNKSFVEAGSGSLPTEKISSYSIIIESQHVKPNDIYKRFLSTKIPVIGYIKNDAFRIDLKAIPNDQINCLISSIKECLI